jgi:hypothetical protein
MVVKDSPPKGMHMLFLLVIVNFAISWFNAWGCGKTWTSTKARGGMPHFMNWMGAIMSASGFTWCYVVVLAIVATMIPIEDETTKVVAPLLSQAQAKVVFDLGYLVIIFPVLGSGLAITVQSWRAFARSRSVGDGAVAGWNTFAQFSNIHDAMRYVPNAWEGVSSLFSGGKDDDSDDFKVKIIIILVAAALLGGVLTTLGIIRATASSAMLDDLARR